jgi:hypothetical protein
MRVRPTQPAHGGEAARRSHLPADTARETFLDALGGATMRGPRFAFLIVAVLALAAVPTAAGAHGGPAENFTATFKDFSETFTDINPCSGATGTVTTTQNGVLHVTMHPDGHFHLTGTFTGPFTFVPDDPTQPTFTGRFTTWFGENHNPSRANTTFTFSVRGTGSDGSRLIFTVVGHITAATIDFSTDPPTITDVVVEFEKARCH